jgi:hypothetical protein
VAQEGQLNKFWCRVFQTKFDILVAICDEEVLGKKMKYKDVKLKIDENFYRGRKIDEKIAVVLLKKATIANLFGKRIIKLALTNRFIDKKNIILINGHPHAQIVKL